MLPQPTLRQRLHRPRAPRRTRAARPRALRPRVRSPRLPPTHLQAQLPPTLLSARSRPRKPRRPTRPHPPPPLHLLLRQVQRQRLPQTLLRARSRHRRKARPQRQLLPPLHLLLLPQVQWGHPRRAQLRPRNPHPLRARLPPLPTIQRGTRRISCQENRYQGRPDGLRFRCRDCRCQVLGQSLGQYRQQGLPQERTLVWQNEERPIHDGRRSQSRRIQGISERLIQSLRRETNDW